MQALRDLTRTRRELKSEREDNVERIDKVLKGDNVKLGSVLSEIKGESGRASRTPAAGESRPEKLAGLLRTNVRDSRAR